MRQPRVNVRDGDNFANLRVWVRQYVKLLMEAEGVNIVRATPPAVQEASSDR